MQLKKFQTVIMLLIALSAISCRNQQKILQPTSEVLEIHDTIVRVHDSVITMPADSSVFHALLKCDSTGNVVMDELNMTKSERSHLQVSLISLKNQMKLKRLNITAYADSFTTIISSKDSLIRCLKNEKHTQIVYVEKNLNAIQKILLYAGGVFICLIIISVILWIKKL